MDNHGNSKQIFYEQLTQGSRFVVGNINVINFIEGKLGVVWHPICWVGVTCLEQNNLAFMLSWSSSVVRNQPDTPTTGEATATKVLTLNHFWWLQMRSMQSYVWLENQPFRSHENPSQMSFVVSTAQSIEYCNRKQKATKAKLSAVEVNRKATNDDNSLSSAVMKKAAKQSLV